MTSPISEDTVHQRATPVLRRARKDRDQEAELQLLEAAQLAEQTGAAETWIHDIDRDVRPRCS